MSGVSLVEENEVFIFNYVVFEMVVNYVSDYVEWVVE